MRPTKLQALGLGLLLAAAVVAGLTVVHDRPARAQGRGHGMSGDMQIGPDQDVTYAHKVLGNLPDEHTGFMPFPGKSGSYLLFGASNVDGQGGAIVLETRNFTDFRFVDGYSHQVMTPFTKFNDCDQKPDTGFDENYAAPGDVIQDPKSPQTMYMIYEAENHCPGGQYDHDFYATVGFAVSTDGGKTWPAAVNSETGVTNRRPVLKLNAKEQTSPPATGMGDAIPSAMADGGYLYILYTYHSGKQAGAADQIRMARAKISGGANMSFTKWDGSWSPGGKGIGGDDSTVLPQPACPGRTVMPSMAVNDALGGYTMLFVCEDTKGATASWYTSHATSLDKQDWSTPKPINGSEAAVSKCKANGGDFDGFYPSMVSPGAAAGHVSSTGYIFFMKGCNRSTDRSFVSRTFSFGASGSPKPPGGPGPRCQSPQTCCMQSGGTWSGGRCT